MTYNCIDWKQLWELHAHDFKDGFAHIPLIEERSFRLLPGAGFGDYSHPTTRLMIEAMAPLVQGRTIADVGCGSAILSIAAILLGAREVYALEIDPDARLHAADNIALHNLSTQIHLAPPPTTPDLVLINMISSEQALARAQNPFITEAPLILTSGLLPHEEASYLAQLPPHYQITERYHLNNWLALLLTKK